jgi:hypothetical protein
VTCGSETPHKSLLVGLVHPTALTLGTLLTDRNENTERLPGGTALLEVPFDRNSRTTYAPCHGQCMCLGIQRKWCLLSKRHCRLYKEIGISILDSMFMSSDAIRFPSVRCLDVTKIAPEVTRRGMV